MIKIIFIFLLLLTQSFGNSIFGVEKYDEEIDLEAQIITSIIKELTPNNLNLFIPRIKKEEKSIYSKYLAVQNQCKNSEVIFVKNSRQLNDCKNEKNKIYFTNNYKMLLENSKFIGAFFWHKNRPNIVFIKDRLEEKNIKLSKNLNKYIEDF